MYNLNPITMAKIYGLFGSMNGKVADVVMAVRNGEQIVRKYQPTVANPSTPNQVQARAKLKLMSQLSAVLGSSIAIPRMGAISSRNMFVKTNYPLATYTDSKADINLAALQLTKSVVGIPTVALSADFTSVGIDTGEPLDLSRVVYVFLKIEADQSIRFVKSAVSEDEGVGARRFPVDTGALVGNHVILAYGVRDNTDAARVVFANMVGVTAESVARVIVSRTLTEADITLTETVGVTHNFVPGT